MLTVIVLLSSRSILTATKPEDAFEIIAIEHSFMYDLLYTKAILLYGIWGTAR